MLFGKDATRTFMSTVLEIGTTSAVISSNDGCQGMLKVFEEPGINPGQYCTDICRKRNNRIQGM